MKSLSTCVCVVIATGAFSVPANADIVEVRYDFPGNVNTSVLYGYFGGDAPVEGRIISTSLVIENYLVGSGNDASNFYLTFDVPVIDSIETQVRLLGDELGWSGTGSFSHAFTTDVYNGTIRPGRFGAEFVGGGTFVGDAYISFTVDTNPVPAPGTLALLGGAGLMGVRRRR
ncbi:MAG: PEP-CTERM sorting domain-containing protein [Phycisphaerales bacterium]|nr:PEP-CTERM sorting domain-containing protein [Phycisphaerales bacterium]